MNNFPLWHWHIENSSICNLRCPRCPRNEVPESLVQTSLDLQFFKKNFDDKILPHVYQISFCGDDGDPIYGKEFLEIVQYLKLQRPDISLRIITNGSSKPVSWWNEIGKSLNQYDEIHFSIDGWDNDSNNQYRVNSRYDTIIDGIKAIRNSNVIMTWAAIAFSFNFSKLDYMRDIAENLGFDKFQITYSTKFGSKYANYLTNGLDLLEPPVDYIPKGHRFTRKITNLTDRQVLDNGKNLINENLWLQTQPIKNIIPMCNIGNKGLYISSQGYFYPCCWVANRYNHNQWQSFRKEKYNLNNNTITEVLNDESWTQFFNNLEAHSECVNKCNKDNFNKEYATSW